MMEENPYEEKPLLDSSGEPIVIMRGAYGLFSMHPEYTAAKAVRDYQDAEEAKRKAAEADDEEIVDVDDTGADAEEEAKVPYEQWTGKELLAEVKHREIEFTPPVKKRDLVALLNEADAGSKG